MSWRLELKFAIKELSKLWRTSWVELSALERTAEANVWCHANWNFSYSLNLVEKLFYAACRKFIELSQYAQTRSKEMRAKLVWNPKSWKKWGLRSETLIYSRFFSAPQHNFLSVLEPWKRTVKSMNDDGKQNLDWIFAIAFSHFSSRRERNRFKPRSDTFIFSSFYFALFASILD